MRNTLIDNVVDKLGNYNVKWNSKLVVNSLKTENRKVFWDVG